MRICLIFLVIQTVFLGNLNLRASSFEGYESDDDWVYLPHDGDLFDEAVSLKHQSPIIEYLRSKARFHAYKKNRDLFEYRPHIRSTFSFGWEIYVVEEIMGRLGGDEFYEGFLDLYLNHAAQLLRSFFSKRPIEGMPALEFQMWKYTALIIAFKHECDEGLWSVDIISILNEIFTEWAIQREWNQFEMLMLATVDRIQPNVNEHRQIKELQRFKEKHSWVYKTSDVSLSSTDRIIRKRSETKRAKRLQGFRKKYLSTQIPRKKRSEIL